MTRLPRQRAPSALLPPLLLLGACGILVQGCSGVRSLGWEIVFGAGVDADRAMVVEGRVLLGGCGGTEVWSAQAARGETPAAPPELAPGTYGLAGRAIDATCTVYAEGCVEVTLPASDASVTITLSASTEVAACPASECVGGRCGGGDAGPPDAGPNDGGTDAGADAGVDSGPVPCTGDGECGECGRCAAGTCVAVDDDTTCTGGVCIGGGCCTGCVDSGACMAGTAASACGAGGGACVACACPTDACDTGSCVVGRPLDALTATENGTCAVTGGTAYCWGSNIFGQLGIGTAGIGTEVAVPTTPTTSESFDALAGGDDHVLAMSSGAIYSWGSSSDGQLGLGDTSDRQVPNLVSGPATWRTVAAATAGDHSCAIRMDDVLHCVGQNDFGQLGLADNTSRDTFTALPGTWSAVGLGHHHTCAIQAGSLYCWGENTEGQLGLGPTEVGFDRNAPALVGTFTDWREADAGDNYSCGIRTSGALYCWGANGDGQLGLGDLVRHASPQRVGTDTDWATVRLGEFHGCALKTDGSLYCWGRNSAAQLGQGSSSARIATPTRVGTATGWTAVAAGLDHTCAVDGESALHCWGGNSLGQLGLGDRAQRVSPTPVCW